MKSTTQKRVLGLDSLRFMAASIVFLGHLIFTIQGAKIPKNLAGHLLAPIHTGAYAVLFFFALSGFVLSNQNLQQISARKWFLSRWIRLMPVYYVTYFIGLLALILGKGYKPLPQNLLVEILGLGAITTLGVPAPNPPLWSLSVELLLSLFFPLLIRIQRVRFLLLLLILSVSMEQTSLGSISLFDAFPYFLVGIIASKLKYSGNKKLHNWLLLLFLAVFVIFSPALIVAPASMFESLLAISGICGLLLLGSHIEIPEKFISGTKLISSRSYSLYATHWTVIKIVQEICYPKSTLLWLLYCSVSIVLVAICTECLYRFVELPAIAASKRLRNS